jgi:hypothetical protein
MEYEFDTAEYDGKYREWKNTHNSDMNYTAFLRAVGHTCEDSILNFMFKQQIIDDVCTRRNEIVRVENIVDPEFGLCWRLVINSTLMQNESGTPNVCKFDLFLNFIKLFNKYTRVKFAGTQGGISFLLNANIKEYGSLIKNNYADEGFVMQLTYGGYINMVCDG